MTHKYAEVMELMAIRRKAYRRTPTRHEPGRHRLLKAVFFNMRTSFRLVFRIFLLTQVAGPTKGSDDFPRQGDLKIAEETSRLIGLYGAPQRLRGRGQDYPIWKVPATAKETAA